MPQKECVALLLGTGSVENAWSPVIKAFKDVMNIEVTPDGAPATARILSRGV